jgi:hypothetical protein
MSVAASLVGKIQSARAHFREVSYRGESKMPRARDKHSGMARRLHVYQFAQRSLSIAMTPRGEESGKTPLTCAVIQA